MVIGDRVRRARRREECGGDAGMIIASVAVVETWTTSVGLWWWQRAGFHGSQQVERETGSRMLSWPSPHSLHLDTSVKTASPSDSSDVIVLGPAKRTPRPLYDGNLLFVPSLSITVPRSKA